MYCVVVCFVVEVVVLRGEGSVVVGLPLRAETAEGVPARVDGAVAGSVVDAVHKLVLKLGVLVVGAASAVLAQQGAHLAVALAQGVDMLDGDCEHDGLVNHEGHVEVGVGGGNDEQLVVLVAVFIAELYGDMIVGVDRENQVVETTGADERESAGEVEAEVERVAMTGHDKLDLDVGVVDLIVFHIDKKLLAEVVAEVVLTLGQAVEPELEVGEFSHCQKGVYG